MSKHNRKENESPTDEEIEDYSEWYPYFLLIAILIIGILIGANLFQENGYDVNIYTEILSIIATVGIIESLQRKRDHDRGVREFKEQLIRDASSSSNETAKRAISEIRHRGWLFGKDALLRGKNLSWANLKGANLSKADLEGVNFENALLEEADLSEANLRNTNLFNAKLPRAILSNTDISSSYCVGADFSYVDFEFTTFDNVNFAEADLQFADFSNKRLSGIKFELTGLSFANFEGANLTQIYFESCWLQGTNFTNANMHGTVFEKAIYSFVKHGNIFSEETTMPDGSKWYEGIELEKFTNPNHSNFWARPERKPIIVKAKDLYKQMSQEGNTE